MPKPADSKREEFRRYLEKTGVIVALTKVLVNLYEEPDKPDDALPYIRDKLIQLVGGDTMDHYKSELEKATNKIAHLEAELGQLKISSPEEITDEGAPVPAEDSPDEGTVA